MHCYYHAAKEGARRNHTSQAERRPNTSSTLPRISSLPKDAHLLPFQGKQHQFVATQNDRYLKRTRSTPQQRYGCEDTEEEAITLSPMRNTHTYPVGLSSLGENHNPPHPPPPSSQVTTAWQQTAKQSLAKTKSKIHRVFSGLTMRAPTCNSDRDAEFEVGSEMGKRLVSPAGYGDTNHRLPSLYSNTAQYGSPQKRVL